MVERALVPPRDDAFPTHMPLFVALLIGTVLLVGAMTFMPALALRTVVEGLMR